MQVFLSVSPESDEVFVMATMLSDDSPPVRGHFRYSVRAGGGLFGFSFEELKALGNGAHELEHRPFDPVG
jgi:hypothetical protein